MAAQLWVYEVSRRSVLHSGPYYKPFPYTFLTIRLREFGVRKFANQDSKSLHKILATVTKVLHAAQRFSSVRLTKVHNITLKNASRC